MGPPIFQSSFGAWVFSGAWWLVIGASIGLGAAPSLDCLYPVAVQRSTTNVVTAVGKFDPWPVKAWTAAKGVTFVAETNKGKFRVEVGADAKAGPYFVRAYNEQGASAPKFLLVTDDAEWGEKEPNNDFEEAQKLEKLPAAVNGRFDKTDDVDLYRIELEKGRTLVASVEAYVMGSPVDAVLRLLDARGVEVAFNHDDGRTLDPEIVYTAARSGSYFVQAFGFNYPADSNIRFVGNDKCVYRLKVACGKREEPFVGCRRETEPNNTLTNATAIDAPGTISGCIGSERDEDVFKFAAKKGDKFVLKVESAAFGFPVDARLGLKNEKQEEVAKADDSGGPDPALDWSAGGDGTYYAVVRNLLNRGGEDHRYRLQIERATPGLKATVGDDAFSIEPGKTNKVKVSLKRLHGFDGKVKVTVEGLPEGVVCEAVEVDGKATEATLALVAGGEAKASSGPMRVVVRGNFNTENTEGKMFATHELTTLGENNGVPNGYSRLLINGVEDLWLTVTAKGK